MKDVETSQQLIDQICRYAQARSIETAWPPGVLVLYCTSTTPPPLLIGCFFHQTGSDAIELLTYPIVPDDGADREMRAMAMALANQPLIDPQARARRAGHPKLHRRWIQVTPQAMTDAWLDDLFADVEREARARMEST
jgi:hypothetical protein